MTLNGFNLIQNSKLESSKINVNFKQKIDKLMDIQLYKVETLVLNLGYSENIVFYANVISFGNISIFNYGDKPLYNVEIPIYFDMYIKSLIDSPLLPISISISNSQNNSFCTINGSLFSYVKFCVHSSNLKIIDNIYIECFFPTNQKYTIISNQNQVFSTFEGYLSCVDFISEKSKSINIDFYQSPSDNSEIEINNATFSIFNFCPIANISIRGTANFLISHFIGTGHSVSIENLISYSISLTLWPDITFLEFQNCNNLETFSLEYFNSKAIKQLYQSYTKFLKLPENHKTTFDKEDFEILLIDGVYNFKVKRLYGDDIIEGVCFGIVTNPECSIHYYNNFPNSIELRDSNVYKIFVNTSDLASLSVRTANDHPSFGLVVQSYINQIEIKMSPNVIAKLNSINLNCATLETDEEYSFDYGNTPTVELINSRISDKIVIPRKGIETDCKSTINLNQSHLSDVVIIGELAYTDEILGLNFVNGNTKITLKAKNVIFGEKPITVNFNFYGKVTISMFNPSIHHIKNIYSQDFELTVMDSYLIIPGIYSVEVIKTKSPTVTVKYFNSGIEVILQSFEEIKIDISKVFTKTFHGPNAQFVLEDAVIEDKKYNFETVKMKNSVYQRNSFVNATNLELEGYPFIVHSELDRSKPSTIFALSLTVDESEVVVVNASSNSSDLFTEEMPKGIPVFCVSGNIPGRLFPSWYETSDSNISIAVDPNNENFRVDNIGGCAFAVSHRDTPNEKPTIVPLYYINIGAFLGTVFSILLGTLITAIVRRAYSKKNITKNEAQSAVFESILDDDL